MRTDVVVVGGGPAGSTAALQLARAGHAVTVVERQAFPRAKPCGESINVGAVRELRTLGLLDRIRELPHCEVLEWRVSARHGRGFSGRLDEPGLAIDRALLDARMLDIAAGEGARIEFERQVTDLHFEDGRVAGVKLRDGGTLRARFVIGADGLRSVVLRRLGLLARRPKLRKVALTAHVHGAEIDRGVGELRLAEWGCAGLVRVADAKTNVALVISERCSDLLDRGREGAFDTLNASLDGMGAAVRTSAVLATGPFDCPVRARTAPGALLVGDAAGYYDPFTGQGIFRALRGGRLAAGAISRVLSEGAPEAEVLRDYETALRGATRWKVGLQHVIEAVTSRPRIMAGAASFLAARPDMANRLIAVTGDADPISHLMPGSA